MTEIERSGLKGFERIATSCDVLHVVNRLATDQRLAHRPVAVPDLRCGCAEIVEESRFLQQGNFNRLRETTDEVAIWQCAQ